MPISFCTVSRNRLQHVKSTFLRNIEDNGDPNLEFLLLDYNSSDGLEEWAKDNLMELINKGIVSFYKTKEPNFFQRSHSRNMAFRLASKNIVCNVDADNFIGRNFSSFIKETYSDSNSIFICAGGVNDNIPIPDIGGRICVRRSDFLTLGGYDEEMNNYGFEDWDFINRLELLGLRKILIKDNVFLQVISHGPTERLQEEYFFKHIKYVLISYLNAFCSKVIFIFRDSKCYMGTLVDKTAEFSHDYQNLFNPIPRFEIVIREEEWIEGKVDLRSKNKIYFNDGKQADLKMDSSKRFILGTKEGTRKYYLVTQKDQKTRLLMLLSQLRNRAIMEFHSKTQVLSVNNQNFGTGIVYKNFDYSNPIILK